MPPRCSIRITEDAVCITHRGQQFGPFEYQWSMDLRGIEFLFEGVKFGEFCNSEELFADLKEFALPMSVCRVATIALGVVVAGLLAGTPRAERYDEIRRVLLQEELSHFTLVDDEAENRDSA